MTRIRVLVVEDSLTVRRQLCDILAADPGLEVVGEAEDGKRAIELCATLRPDVISMDMMMPVMSGLAATEYIMAHQPVPILVVSSSFNRGELFKTYDALAAGAVDVIDKPRGDEEPGVWERRYLTTVKLVSRIRVITHPRAKLRPRPDTPTVRPPIPAPAVRDLLAIGASTGGPGAVVSILRSLPRRLRTPILLVVHLNEAFGAAFAEWLGNQSPHPVAFARDGEVPGPGVAMAPPGWHLVLEQGRFRLTKGPERHSCRPSVDVLFESIAREVGPGAVACLLTGMGRDGAAGLLAIRNAGGFTIAQDEATSVVFGMPREAVALDAATKVLPLPDIGPFLGTLLERSA
ncbi:MAG: chemotaxis-specific protein-glutamate methyltransferase CheB [Kofleriaceae bacterium]|nr:chemotaxis-specific protein-glutamate methyltransferase CheB [Kofleriaceae bacterium]